MKIHGVEILNCGSGMSIDDITTDEACTFIARSVTPWNSSHAGGLDSTVAPIPGSTVGGAAFAIGATPAT
jgi:hypothetical protein